MALIMNAVKRAVRQRWAYYFILPGYAVFLIFNFFPMLRTIHLSLFDYQLTSKSFIGLQNYEKLFDDRVFVSSLLNTLKYAALVTPASVALSLFIAVTLLPLGRGLQSFLRGAFFIPNVVGGVIISAIWLWIYHPVHGFLNYMLSGFGVAPVSWLSDVATVIPATSLVVLTWTIGNMIIIYMAGLGSIPSVVYEAAKIDGASPFRTFRHITLPLLKPISAFVVTTQLIFCFQIWDVVYLLTGGGPFHKSSTLVFDIYRRAFVKGDYGAASAEGTVLIAIIAVVTLLSLYLFRENRRFA